MFEVTSKSFSKGAPIPATYTCDGDDVSPQLAWRAPEGTKAFAIICDDPDAPRGDWVHWIVYNLPASTTSLDEDATVVATLGRNDFGKTAYGGPCPPPGKPHRYYFKVYALDSMLDLSPGATKQALVEAMQKHILDQGELMGTYARS